MHGDLLITFPQCKDASCNALFYEAFKAREDNGQAVSTTTYPENRTLAQVRAFGPADLIGTLYSQR